MSPSALLTTLTQRGGGIDDDVDVQEEVLFQQCTVASTPSSKLNPSL